MILLAEIGQILTLRRKNKLKKSRFLCLKNFQKASAETYKLKLYQITLQMTGTDRRAFFALVESKKFG